MIVYLDESGDLGWKFDQPFNNGGSSRFLTIAYITVPNNKTNIPHRQVSKTHNKFNLSFQSEHKGCDLKEVEREYFVQRTINMLNDNDDVKLGVITVRKDRVFEHIRRDANILYNYATNLGICDQIKDCNGNVELIRDERSIKVKSGNSLVDYLQTQLWFEKNSKALLIDKPAKSHQNLNVLFIDWICNTVWNYYEYNLDIGFSTLSPYMSIQTLFF